MRAGEGELLLVNHADYTKTTIHSNLLALGATRG